MALRSALGLTRSRSIMGTLVAGCALLLFAAPPASFAEEGSDRYEYASSGIYIGGGFGLGFEQYKGALAGPDYQVGIGFDIFGGYRFGRYIAVEAQFEYIDRVDTEIDDPGVKTLLQTFTVQAKPYLPFGRWQPFLLGGIGVTKITTQVNKNKNKINDNSLSFRAGGGLEYYATENIAATVSASYVIPVCSNGFTCGYRYVSALFGVQYRF